MNILKKVKYLVISLWCKHEYALTDKRHGNHGNNHVRREVTFRTYHCIHCNKEKIEIGRPEFPKHPPKILRKKKLLLREE